MITDVVTTLVLASGKTFLVSGISIQNCIIDVALFILTQFSQVNLPSINNGQGRTQPMILKGFQSELVDISVKLSGLLVNSDRVFGPN